MHPRHATVMGLQRVGLDLATTQQQPAASSRMEVPPQVLPKRPDHLSHPTSTFSKRDTRIGWHLGLSTRVLVLEPGQMSLHLQRN